MLSPSRENAKIITVKHKAAEVMRRLTAACNDEFVIYPTAKSVRCDSCKSTIREGGTDCWACGKPIADGLDGFVVKLAKSGLEPHGFTGSLIASINPVSINCNLLEDGNCTRLEIHLSGGPTPLEIAGFTIFCIMLGWFVESSGMSHFLGALFIALFLPLFWIVHRRDQEKKLREFMQKQLPNLLQ